MNPVTIFGKVITFISYLILLPFWFVGVVVGTIVGHIKCGFSDAKEVFSQFE